MTNAREQLVAYLATLAALVIIIIATLVAMSRGITVGESVGTSIAIGGLIGVLKIPSQRSVTVDNSPTDPVPTQDAAP